MALKMFLLAMIATLALAAPADLRKRSFAVPAQGFIDPAKAIARAHRKWGDNAAAPVIVANKVAITHTVTVAVTVTAGPPSSSPTSSLATSISSIGSTSLSTLASSTSVSSTSVSSTSVSSTSVSSTSVSSTSSSTSVSEPVAYQSATSSISTPAASQVTANSGEVVAEPEENDKAYLSPVSIGGQTLTLDFDTGSADLWVFSTRLSQFEIGGHTAFDSSKSSTWSEYTGGTWNISYGDGSHALGVVGFDTVDIGGVSVAKQCVEIATDISDEFTNEVQSDGLLGLGFSVVNTVEPQQQKTFFENVMSSLAQPLFTADLDKQAAGTYEFGRIDTSSYVGDIFWTPITSAHGYWEFESRSFGVGNSTTACPTCSNAIADTGTSLMLMDAKIVRAYYAAVDAVTYDTYIGGYTYPCDATLPDFHVAIGSGYVATIKGADMTYVETGNGDGKCFGGLQTGPGSIQILGDMFFKSYFAVFDGGNTRLGVAKKS